MKEGPSPYRLPAEWEPRHGTLVAWLSDPVIWGDCYPEARQEMLQLITVLSRHEKTYVALNPEDDRGTILRDLLHQGCAEDQLTFLEIPHEDSWMRDSGPHFVLPGRGRPGRPRILLWNFNAWGGKYVPHEKDSRFSRNFARLWGERADVSEPGIVFEGGSLEGNGNGVALTTRSCLLHPNRNGGLAQEALETILREHLGIQTLIWLDSGISGDDTDGHIDDFARFVAEDVIVMAQGTDPEDPDTQVLAKGRALLDCHPLVRSSKIRVETLPMPAPFVREGERFPASFANFYMVPGALLLPDFGDAMTAEAVDCLQSLCPGREIIPVSCKALIQGRGGIHCLTQPLFGVTP